MQSDAPVSKSPAGKRFQPGAAQREIARRGGRAKAAKRKMLDSLGLLALDRDPEFQPYREAAEGLLAALSGELADKCGGHIGAAPSLLLATASLQTAASRFFIARGIKAKQREDVEAGSRLGNHARANVVAAYDMAPKTPEDFRTGPPSLPPKAEEAKPPKLPDLDEALSD